MSLMEKQSLDMSRLLLKAYEIGDLINDSRETSEYKHWKRQVADNGEIQSVIREFAKRKEQFEDCQRFGHFHPDYHKALDAVKETEAKLDSFEEVRQYKAAEARLDELLHSVSTLIARAVSETVKVPGNGLQPEGGCSSGGACGGNCGCS